MISDINFVMQKSKLVIYVTPKIVSQIVNTNRCVSNTKIALLALIPKIALMNINFVDTTKIIVPDKILC